MAEPTYWKTVTTVRYFYHDHQKAIDNAKPDTKLYVFKKMLDTYNELEELTVVNDINAYTKNTIYRCIVDVLNTMVSIIRECKKEEEKK